MADFNQAIKWLEAGKKVKRSCWAKSNFYKEARIEEGEERIIIDENSIIVTLDLIEVQATNWEIYKDSDEATAESPEINLSLDLSEKKGSLSFGIFWITLDGRLKSEWFQTKKLAGEHYGWLKYLGVRPSFVIKLSEKKILESHIKSMEPKLLFSFPKSGALSVEKVKEFIKLQVERINHEIDLAKEDDHKRSLLVIRTMLEVDADDKLINN